MPATCLAVDTDTLGFNTGGIGRGVGGDGDGSGTHKLFCDVLRAIVPRLRHWRPSLSCCARRFSSPLASVNRVELATTAKKGRMWLRRRQKRS
jgi:hypothetical protein